MTVLIGESFEDGFSQIDRVLSKSTGTKINSNAKSDLSRTKQNCTLILNLLECRPEVNENTPQSIAHSYPFRGSDQPPEETNATDTVKQRRNLSGHHCGRQARMVDSRLVHLVRRSNRQVKPPSSQQQKTKAKTKLEMDPHHFASTHDPFSFLNYAALTTSWLNGQRVQWRPWTNIRAR